jgi:hypothetical protein
MNFREASVSKTDPYPASVRLYVRELRNERARVDIRGFEVVEVFTVSQAVEYEDVGADVMCYRVYIKRKDEKIPWPAECVATLTYKDRKENLTAHIAPPDSLLTNPRLPFYSNNWSNTGSQLMPGGKLLPNLPRIRKWKWLSIRDAKLGMVDGTAHADIEPPPLVYHELLESKDGRFAAIAGWPPGDVPKDLKMTTVNRNGRKDTFAIPSAGSHTRGLEMKWIVEPASSAR